MNKYGKSTRYEGDEGVSYFAYQQKSGMLGAPITADHFRPYISKRDTVLDFGCGGGYVLNELTCMRKVGVELNPLPRANAEKLGLECYDGTMHVGQGTIDVVISNHCLEHVPYPIAALMELRRVLKDDGRLVIVVPVDDWRVQRDYTGEDIDHHLHTWTPRLVANTLRESGFKVDSARVITSAWPPRFDLFYRFLPRSFFRLIFALFGFLRCRREMIVIARPR